MWQEIQELTQAVVDRDPACHSRWQAFWFNPGVKALLYHRLAHRHYQKGQLFRAHWLATRARRLTGIEIHPGAKIGRAPMIDHGMGVVIGETAVIGDHVQIFHGVTLGGMSGQPGEKRHPTLGDHVFIGAEAMVLGNVTLGDHVKVGAGAVVLTDIPAHKTAVGVPAEVVGEH